jgi:hypothetical protein
MGCGRYNGQDVHGFVGSWALGVFLEISWFLGVLLRLDGFSSSWDFLGFSGFY